MQTELEPTTERIILEHYQDSAEHYLLHLLHIITYRFAEKYTAGKDVFDFGCGSGYGSAMVAESARSVVAVDVATDAIEYAKSHFAKPNLEFRVIDPDRPLPFEDARFDTVLSFQVIEHVPDPDAYLREIVRVLKPGGVLVMATPDRRTRLLPLQRPWNRYHLKEYSDRSLARLLQRHFARTDVYTMGGDRSVLDIELRRTRRLMWTSLPFTLPFVPEPLRVGALGLIKTLKARVRPESRAASKESKTFAFSEKDLSIAPGLWPSVNVVVVARRA